MPPRDTPRFRFEQGVFSQGVATTPDPRLLQEAQYQRSTNAYPGRDGRIHKRRGFESLVAELENVRAARWFITERGDRLLVIWHADKVSWWDGVDLTELRSGLDTDHEIAHEAWNDKAYFSDGVNGLMHVAYPYEAQNASGTLDVEKVAYEAASGGGIISG